MNQATFCTNDGWSTDKSITEQDIVYVRVARMGTVKEHFVSQESVEKVDAAWLSEDCGYCH